MSDPMMMSGLESEAIDKAVAERRKAPNSQAAAMRAENESKKEERLAKKEERLGSGRSQASAPQTAPPPHVEVKDRSAMLDKLGQYKERFPDLKSRNKITGKSTVEEIEDELHYVEMQLGGSKDGNFATTIFVASMAGLEHITAHHFNPLNLNLTGLSSVARDNTKEIQPVLDELVIKYGINMYMSPEVRLITTVATLVYTVHAANSGDAATMAALEKMKTPFKAPATDL